MNKKCKKEVYITNIYIHKKCVRSACKIMSSLKSTEFNMTL